MGDARYDPTTNRMVRTDAPAGIQNVRTRFTVAQINAGATLLPAVPGFTYRLTGLRMIPIGGAVTGLTALVILGTRAAGAVTLVSAAAAALTQSTPVRYDSANVTILADGASFTPLDANTAVTVGKTGGNAATATHVDVFADYVLEAA